MLCDICGKNQATVHLTEIIDEQMNELHLCEQCAQTKSQEMEQQFGLSDLLAGMVESGKPPMLEKEAATLQCPNCKLTYVDFKKIGRFGCGGCYTTFKKYIGPLLRRIHGSGQHIGKSPLKAANGLKKKVDLHDLRLKLKNAIELEAFEEAARIRDQIKEAENKQPQGGEDAA